MLTLYTSVTYHKSLFVLHRCRIFGLYPFLFISFIVHFSITLTPGFQAHMFPCIQHLLIWLYLIHHQGLSMNIHALPISLSQYYSQLSSWLSCPCHPETMFCNYMVLGSKNDKGLQ